MAKHIYDPNPIKGAESYNCYLDFTNSNNFGFSYTNSNVNNATKITDEQAKYPFALNLVFKKGTVIDMDLQSAEAYVNSEYVIALTELGV